MNIQTNPSAPVYHKDEITIHAPVQRVWEILTRIEEWPEWQAAVTQANVLGDLKEGVIFKWKAAGLSFTSQVHTIILHREFGWTGKTIGTTAVHNWRFTDLENQTKVQVEECLEGFLPKLFRKSFQKSLEKGMRTSLQELKQDAENQ